MTVPPALRRAFFSLLASTLVLVARPATATPNFPGAVQGTLGASAPPDCAICHVCGVTGRGTVNTPWGSAMRARGLEAYNETSLRAALAAMASDRVDSDGDGTIDVEAVKMGKDPNGDGCVAGEDPTVPMYGCFGRVASEPPGAETAVFIAALLVAALARRRRGALVGLLVLTLATSSLAACRSGASLAPRGELFAAEVASSQGRPRMTPVQKTAFASDLEALGLDPKNLPPFQSLEPRQVRRLMSTFTRSLGYACTDCHARADYRVPTDVKKITVHMWDEMTRRFAFGDGSPVYCDSCHQGQGRTLDRSDRKAVAAWMSENFTTKLVFAAGAKDRDVECETCHGDPFEPSILARWTK